MICDDVLNNGLMFVDVYMYICGGRIRIWILYIYIYMVRFEFELFFFLLKKSTIGAVLDWTVLTNTHSRGGWWYSRPYRSPLQGRLILPAAPTEVTVGAAENTSRPYRGHCKGGWKHQPPLQRELQGRSGNHPYRGTLCRNTLGGAADEAAPTEALESPPTVNFCSSEWRLYRKVMMKIS